MALRLNADSRSISRYDESLDEEYEDDESVHSNIFKTGKDTVKLRATAYDGVVLALVCLMDADYVTTHGFGCTCLQLVLVLCVHIASVLLQITVMIFLIVTVVQRQADPYRDGLPERTREIQAAITANPPQRLDEDDPALMFCNEMETLPHSHLLIIFLWSSKLLGELEDLVWRMTNVCKLPSVRGQHGKVLEKDEDGSIIITNLRSGAKILLVLVVCLPQTCCAALLYWLGAKFLFFTHRTDILVLKAVSLSFISQLDELMYQAYASISFKERMKKSRYAVELERPGRNWSTWGSTLFQLALSSALSIVVVFIVFGYITTHRHTCFDYFSAFPSTTPGRGSESVWTSFLKGLEIN